MPSEIIFEEIDCQAGNLSFFCSLTYAGIEACQPDLMATSLDFAKGNLRMKIMTVSSEVREYLRILIDLLKVIIWPVIVVVILERYKDVISNAIGRSKEVNLKFAGAEVSITAEEAATSLSEIINEFDKIILEHLKSDERLLFLKISKLLDPPTVESIFPNFNRDTDVARLKQLRALRGVNFIYPIPDKRWQPTTLIGVTTLGKLVVRYKRELFLSETDTVSVN